MNRIFIKCPETGRLIFTGFAMDPQIFDTSPVEQNAIQCPVCGQEHQWQKSDAILEKEKAS